MCVHEPLPSQDASLQPSQFLEACFQHHGGRGQQASFPALFTQIRSLGVRRGQHGWVTAGSFGSSSSLSAQPLRVHPARGTDSRTGAPRTQGKGEAGALGLGGWSPQALRESTGDGMAEADWASRHGHRAGDRGPHSRGKGGR